MKPSFLEAIAAERLVRRSEADEACKSTGHTLESMLDHISSQIAERYLSGEISFTYADSVLNGLFEIILQGSDGRMASDLAWEIYLAFDAGEYNHHGDGPETDPESKYTRPLLVEALRGYKNKKGA